MNIRRSTLLAALASLTSGPLSYTQDYSWTLLSSAWRGTGLRQDDLKEALRYCLAESYMELHGDEVEACYRLTLAGARGLDESRWFPWRRWRDQQVLQRMRLRARIPSIDGEHLRRSEDDGGSLNAH
jgi:hypothetical protein